MYLKQNETKSTKNKLKGMERDTGYRRTLGTSHHKVALDLASSLCSPGQGSQDRTLSPGFRSS